MRFEAVLGAEEATTLMEQSSPVGWADVAMSSDFDAFRDEMRAEFARFRNEMRAEFALLRSDLVEAIDAAQVRLLVGLVPTLVTLVGLTFVLARLG